MNEPDLEKELRALLPTKPTAQLAERIAADLIVPVALGHEPAAGLLPRPVKPKAGFFFQRPWFLTLSGVTVIVAGLFAVAIWTRPESGTPARKQGSSSPVAALNEAPDRSMDELIDAQDEGLVYGEDQAPQRQVRLVYLERHIWTNPQTGAVVEFEVPREDIVLMPVAMQ